MASDGRLRTWFGPEGNPDRARLVRRCCLLTAAALGLVAVAGALGRHGVALAAPLLVLAFVCLGLAVRELARALREPHESTRGRGGSSAVS